jgi:thiol:disulfide interchange protein DsbC
LSKTNDAENPKQDIKMMRRLPLVALTALLALPFSAGVLAAEDYSTQRKLLADAFPDMEFGSIEQSAIPGLLQVSVGADIFYTSADGRYFIQAEIFDLDTRANLTEQSRADARFAYLDDIEAQPAIEFPAADHQYTVTVFTDIDCGYCRKLHQQVADYNDLGVSIRYLFFPRSGPDTTSWAKAESVWCADSQQDALTRAKSGEVLPAADCLPTPVADHYKLVNDLGLTGTPALFTEGGQLLVGYRSPQELIEVLDNE